MLAYVDGWGCSTGTPSHFEQSKVSNRLGKSKSIQSIDQIDANQIKLGIPTPGSKGFICLFNRNPTVPLGFLRAPTAAMAADGSAPSVVLGVGILCIWD